MSSSVASLPTEPNNTGAKNAESASAEPISADQLSASKLAHDSQQDWTLIDAAYQTARQFLLAEQMPNGHWVGELSTSALSTATAISALVQARLNHCVPESKLELVNQAIEQGCQWLMQRQNTDGGWGDTDRSHSNIATTFLVIAASRLAGGQSMDQHPQIVRAWKYVDAKGRWDGLRKRYGKDKTFVVPILSNCALAGLVDWSQVPALPFEAAWLPQKWYRLAKMPVVSYAIPALVAIGQARFHFAPTKIPGLRLLRRLAVEPTLKVLHRMQPASGGYLEATPLTSFVLMNLAAIGKGNLPVSQECLKFILDSRLQDGSWPIDTNLATWGTSLAWHALSRRSKLQISVVDTPSKTILDQHPTIETDTKAAQEESSAPCEVMSEQGLKWLLACQHRTQHPFTGAIPGGWGWTDLSGAVPDADDTPAALLALSNIDWERESTGKFKSQAFEAVGLGLRWLVQLQNRDGGWPTFCRGWGKLPFDRSGTDLTAHAMRAISAWLARYDTVVENCVETPTKQSLHLAVERGHRYLIKTQQADGSWLPLWFGNQDREQEDNPFYGTGKVLLAFAQLNLLQTEQVELALEFLQTHQNPDGGWGGSWQAAKGSSADQVSTIEETAVVLEALLECGGQKVSESSIMAGLTWLAGRVQQGGLAHAKPIGFYFAKLWYYEKLYPALFGLSALGTALRRRKQ